MMLPHPNLPLFLPKEQLAICRHKLVGLKI